MQQARQEATLSELKQVIMQCRLDTQRKVQEYQREVLAAEREVSLAEKKLSKSKEILNNLIYKKDKLIYAPDGKEEGKTGWKQLMLGGINNIVNHANPNLNLSPSDSSKGKDVDRLQEVCTNITTAKDSIRSDVRSLLRIIANRDQIYLASRKALQSLDRECKHMVGIALKALIRREREAQNAKTNVLEKLHHAVNSIDTDADEQDFIDTYKNLGEGISLSSQALSIMSDCEKGLLNENSLILSDERSSPPPAMMEGKENTEAESEAESTDPTIYAKMKDEELISGWLSSIFYASKEQCILKVGSNKPYNVLAFCKKRYEAGEGSDLELSVVQIAKKTVTQVGRDAFVIAFNKFRSKQVDVGDGYYHLGAVIWECLAHCQSYHDVHSAKIIMMLSQTFYMLGESREKKEVTKACDDKSDEDEDEDDDDDDDDDEKGRAAQRRYLREILIGHPLWKESRFWEGALWQLVLEQLQTIPNSDIPWHDVDVVERELAVQRVHAVIFSQVMAIIHSMLELGCTKARTKELVYRMSVIHQLTETQRHSLIRHIIDMKEFVFTDLDTAENENREENTVNDSRLGTRRGVLSDTDLDIPIFQR